MDKNKKSFVRHILNDRGGDADIGKGVRIELTDGRELTVSGCRGFLEYGEERIRLALLSGGLEISGEGLLCDSYLNGAVLIRGKISAIALSEGTDEAVL